MPSEGIVSASRMDQLIALFERAVDLPATEVSEFVSKVAESDKALAEDLQGLLDAHLSASGYFENLAEQLVPPAYAAATSASRDAKTAALLLQTQEALGPSYKVLRELGGGMSRVFLADEVKLGRKVVIKMLPPEMAEGASIERFRREIQLAAQLQHPHIVPLLTSDSVQSLLYYTMPFVAGESLAARLAREGALSLRDAREIWRDVLDALTHAHASGVVHRDIKPGNILLTTRSAVVADFGIARAIQVAGKESADTTQGMGAGTPAYMAPEQVTGNRDADHRVDLYAAGLVMYEMLEGRQPFSGESVRKVALARLTQDPAPITRPDCPPALAALVMQCLARDAASRPLTAEALLAELESIPVTTRVEQATEVGKVSEVESTVERTRRRLPRLLVASVGAVVAIVVVSLGARQLATAERSGAPVSDSASVGPESGIRLAGNAVTAPRRRYVPRIEAYEWYMRGMDLSLLRNKAGNDSAMVYFKRAIAADSGFAAAYAGLAGTIQAGMGEEPGDQSEFLLEAERLALKAIALDDSLAEGHAALGWMRAALRQWGSAVEEFKTAIALDPRSHRVFEGLARAYAFTGPLSDQLAAAKTGLEIDPFSHSAIREYAIALSMNGRCDEALEQLRPLKALIPPAAVAGILRGQCFAAQQKWEDAIAEFRWAWPNGARVGLSFLGYALARSGQRDSARRILSDLQSGRKNSHGAFGIATVHLGLGNLDSAFVWLDKAIDQHSVRVYLMGPMFADLHRDPRFAQARKRMGL
jgi:serine/threonine protein kinase/tetratricopeptide (TPR) repeat protein